LTPGVHCRSSVAAGTLPETAELDAVASVLVVLR
jgi:hypothetical protein